MEGRADWPGHYADLVELARSEWGIVEGEVTDRELTLLAHGWARRKQFEARLLATELAPVFEYAIKKSLIDLFGDKKPTKDKAPPDDDEPERSSKDVLKMFGLPLPPGMT